MMVLSGEDLRTRMQFLKDATAGSVVFGMAPLPAGLFLPRFLVRMLQEVPQINVHAKTGTAQDLLAHVDDGRSEEHTSELQSLMRISYAVFCLKKKTQPHTKQE